MSQRTLVTVLCFMALGWSEQPLVAEEPLPRQMVKRDLNGDGKLQAQEIPAKKRQDLLSRYDKNNDGALDGRELKAFAHDRRASGKKRPKEQAPSSAAVRVIRDISYAPHPKEQGKLDLYIPRGHRDLPVLLWIHGGGLTSGNKEKMAPSSQRFSLNGFLVVAINYRLTPGAKHPDHIRDVARSVRWIVDNIKRYGGDPKRLYVSGGSAGGYLTALLTQDKTYLEEQKLTTKVIRAAIPITGLMDVSQTGARRMGHVWDNSPETIRQASPVAHVRPDAPPMLFMWADGDTAQRREMNRRIVRELKKVGHPRVVQRELKDRTHNTILSNMAKAGDPTLMAMLEFLNKHGARQVPMEGAQD